MASPDDAVQRAVWSWVTPKVPPNDDPFTKMLYESARLQNNDCRVDVLWSNVSFNVTPLQTPETADPTRQHSAQQLSIGLKDRGLNIYIEFNRNNKNESLL